MMMDVDVSSHPGRTLHGASAPGRCCVPSSHPRAWAHLSAGGSGIVDHSGIGLGSGSGWVLD